MKKTLIVIVLGLISCFSFSQITVVAGKHANKFFKSAEDFMNDKPIDGVKLTKWVDYSSSIEFSENGASQKVKISKLQYTWFCNYEGMLMRVFDGDLYYTVVIGKMCFYIKSNEGTISKTSEDTYVLSGKFSDSWPAEYYSLTSTGPIEKLKEKTLEEYLEKNGLKSQYDNDPKYQRERKDCVMCWQEKKTNKMIKYVKLLNGKLQ